MAKTKKQTSKKSNLNNLRDLAQNITVGTAIFSGFIWVITSFNISNTMVDVLSVVLGITVPVIMLGGVVMGVLYLADKNK